MPPAESFHTSAAVLSSSGWSWPTSTQAGMPDPRLAPSLSYGHFSYMILLRALAMDDVSEVKSQVLDQWSDPLPPSRLHSASGRIMRILIFAIAMVASIAAIPAAGAGLWFAIRPTTDILRLVGFVGAVLVASGLFLLVAGLCWMALENVVEEYWQTKWEKWQRFKQQLASRA